MTVEMASRSALSAKRWLTPEAMAIVAGCVVSGGAGPDTAVPVAKALQVRLVELKVSDAVAVSALAYLTALILQMTADAVAADAARAAQSN